MTETHVVAVHVSVGEHHGRVVFVERLPGDGADETRLGAVGKGQVTRQVVQVLTAHRAVGVLARPIVTVTLAGERSSRDFFII